MTALILRLAGPIQSWGTYRLRADSNGVPTAPIPTKSGVAGLVGAALGRRDLPALTEEFDLHVRVERTNAPGSDLQTLGPLPPGPALDYYEALNRITHKRKRTFPNENRADSGNKDVTGGNYAVREFLSFSEFLVLVDVADDATATRWRQCVLDPAYMTYLGRHAYAPTFPFFLGMTSGDPIRELDAIPTVPHHSERVNGDTLERRRYHVTGDYGAHVQSAPTVIDAPVAQNRRDQLTWLSQHLNT